MDSNKIHKLKSQTNYCAQCRVAQYCLPGVLNGLNAEDLNHFKFHAKLLEPGEHLCYQGEIHSHLYLLRSGLLKSYYNKEQGEELVMDFHLPPELFGWEGIDTEQRSFSIVALDYSNVCEFPIEQLKSLTRQHPNLYDRLLALFTKKLRHYNIHIMRTTAEQRVCAFLLSLSRHYKSLGYPHYLCKLGMAHQDIANYLRIAPETISRIFHKLQNQHLITVHRKKIYINNFEGLTELSEGKKLKSA